MNRALLSIFCVGVIACVLGCSSDDRPELGLVRGTVTLDGDPLQSAMVVFEPLEGKAKGSRALTDQQGEYQLTYLRNIKGAVLGTHRVRITTATEHAPEKLPDRYHSRTELTAEVAGSKNALDFELTSLGGSP